METRLKFDFVTSDTMPETRYLVVDEDGEEIATAISEDWAIAIAEALRANESLSEKLNEMGNQILRANGGRSL